MTERLEENEKNSVKDCFCGQLFFWLRLFDVGDAVLDAKNGVLNKTGCKYPL